MYQELENPEGIKFALKTLKELRLRFGTIKTLVHAFFRFINRFFYFDCLNIIALDRENLKPPDPAKTKRLSSKIATLEDLQEMKKQGCWRMDGKLELFHRGDTCLLSYVDNELAGYTWVLTNGSPSFVVCGVRLSVPEQYLYNFWGWTDPRYRGHGLQGFRHREILNNPRWKDKKGLLGFRVHTNHSSKKGQEKSGFKQIGNVYIIGRKSKVHAYVEKNLRNMGIKRISPPSQEETRQVSLS